MSAINKVKPKVVVKTYERGKGYNLSAHMALYLLIANSLLAGDTFYEGQADRLVRLEALATQLNREDPAYVAALAHYARSQLHLRTSPTILTAIMFRDRNPYAKFAAEKVWVRGDEHLEAMAYLQAGGWPRAMLKAVRTRLMGMSAKALLKYSLSDRAVSQRDAIRLTHPRFGQTSDANLAARYLLKGNKAGAIAGMAEADQQAALEVLRSESETWENIISREGSTRGAWAKALEVMGYMALLRNLRNVAEKLGEDDSALADVYARIKDPEQVRRSKQLPFRFLSASKALPNTFVGTRLQDAVHEAANLAVENAPKFDGDTIVLLDFSGSMGATLSDKSQVYRAEASAMLGAILAKGSGAILYGYSNRTWAIPVSKFDTVIQVVEKACKNAEWSGTQTARALANVLQVSKNLPKRVVIITDEQAHDDVSRVALPWLKGGNRHLHIINVAGYEPVSTPDVSGIHRVGGWSERVLDWMVLQEAGLNAKKLIEDYGPKR